METGYGKAEQYLKGKIAIVSHDSEYEGFEVKVKRCTEQGCYVDMAGKEMFFVFGNLEITRKPTDNDIKEFEKWWLDKISSIKKWREKEKSDKTPHDIVDQISRKVKEYVNNQKHKELVYMFEAFSKEWSGNDVKGYYEIARDFLVMLKR